MDRNSNGLFFQGYTQPNNNSNGNQLHHQQQQQQSQQQHSSWHQEDGKEQQPQMPNRLQQTDQNGLPLYSGLMEHFLQQQHMQQQQQLQQLRMRMSSLQQEQQMMRGGGTFLDHQQGTTGPGLEPNDIFHRSQQPSLAWSTASSVPSNPSGADTYAETGVLGPWSETSAGLFGKMAETMAPSKAKKVRKKPKDKPKRPLSAYNLFFKDERQRILAAAPKNDTAPDAEGTTGGSGKRKRKVSPHGKVGFENLAKMIGHRWQDLDKERIAYFKERAAEDMVRYKAEMEVYLAKQQANQEGDEPTSKKLKTAPKQEAK